VGIAPAGRLLISAAHGTGNVLVLLGARTGRDGIGGASVLASAGFEEGSEEKRPSVQVGDPYEEKRLIEACLALLDAGLAVGVQDLGAAGLSCAASETAAAAGAGMDVDIARVHRREPGMNPVEVMTSESQERMLAIVRPEDVDEVLSLCARWEIRASVVGKVTDSGRFRVFDGLFDRTGGLPTEALADVPCGSLGDGPVYDRPMQRPADQDTVNAADPTAELLARFGNGADLGPELLALLGTPTIADKSWVWHQYDHQLFLNTVVGPGGDATVLRLKGTRRALALATDGKGRFCRLDPRTGGRLVVLEAARNVACAGAEPRALVNCLNFGNPEHPEVMWQFSEVVDGMSEACRALDLPVIGGNVSFYNESRGRDIDPTPVVGVVGLLEQLESAPPRAALRADDVIVLVGPETAAEFGGSEWAAVVHGLDGGLPPAADLDAARAVHDLVRALVADRVVAGVHDCSDGGLAVALTEMAIAGETGFTVQPEPGAATAAWCFAETASRVVLSVDQAAVAVVLVRARDVSVRAVTIGTAGGDRLVVDGAIDLALHDAATTWRDAIPNLVAADVHV
jgi:phosphoribosylformylglycinamidine synthase